MTWLDVHDPMHLAQLRGLEAGAVPRPGAMAALLAQGRGRDR